MKSPYVYFGGKSRVADVAWERFGNCRNLVEPFFGSGAVLLKRPSWHMDEQSCVETINDLDCHISNVWRAMAAVPDEVAHYADRMVSEVDLHAIHHFLVFDNSGAEFRQRMRTDPEFYDARRAGWWLYGVNLWIGSGWCDEKMAVYNRNMPPNLTSPNGRGAQRLSHKLPILQNSGVGVHRLSHQLPHWGDASPAPHCPNAATVLKTYFAQLSERMRRVRVCCGDWKRILGPSVTTGLGVTGIFLDPPYQLEGRAKVYAHESDVFAEVRDWCIENGDNRKLRIALCGYDDDAELEALGWDAYAWKANGGYGSAGQNTRGRDNAHRERIWFSPHCLGGKSPSQLSLLSEYT